MPLALSIIVKDEPKQVPVYKYSYEIEDPNTGDSKSQQEMRNGDLVTGSYSLIDPDGTKRTVQYSADSKNGFNAIVHRELITNRPGNQYVNKDYYETGNDPSTRNHFESAINSPHQKQNSYIPVTNNLYTTAVSLSLNSYRNDENAGYPQQNQVLNSNRYTNVLFSPVQMLKVHKPFETMSLNSQLFHPAASGYAYY